MASCCVCDISLRTVTTEHQPLAFLTLRPSTSVRAPPPNWVEDNTLPWQLLCAGPGARNCFFAHTSPSRSVHYTVPPPPRALAHSSSFAVLFPRLLCSSARISSDLKYKVCPFIHVSASCFLSRWSGWFVTVFPQIHLII